MQSAATHSIWSDDKGAFAVIGGDLCAVDDPARPVVVLSGVGDKRIAYSRSPTGAVIWTNGQRIGRIINRAPREITERRPVAPTVTASAGGGSVPAGRYLVMCTAMGPDGESAPSDTQVVDLAAPGALSVSVPGGVGKRLALYVSGPNGSVLGFAGESTTGTFAVTSPSESGHRCATEGLEALPPGQCVAHSDGRLFVASGNVLWYSQPWHEGLMDPSSNFIPLPGRITMVRAVRGVLYIAADQTWRLTSIGAELTEMLPFGALEGSDFASPIDGSAYWGSPRGLIAATSEGVQAVQDNNLTFTKAIVGAGYWRETNGKRHVVASRGNAVGAEITLDAEIVGKDSP